jgi:hypothetical protein
MYNKLMKKIVLRTNLIVIVSVAISLISTTVAVFSLINQKNLNNIINMQDLKISELIKNKKDFQFGQLINNDNSVTSIEELKKMVKELKDNQSILTTQPDIILSDTLPIPEATP